MGGTAVVVPMANLWEGGLVSKYVRRWSPLMAALGKTFYKRVKAR